MAWCLRPTARDDVPTGDDLLPVAPGWVVAVHAMAVTDGRAEAKWMAGWRRSGWSHEDGVGVGRHCTAQDGCARGMAE